MDINIQSHDTGNQPEEQTWDTTQLQEDFEVIGFGAPFVAVRRKADGRQGHAGVHSPSARIFQLPGGLIMARTQDRWIISEAIRKQGLWHLEAIGPTFVELMTNYDERLEIFYGNVGQVLFAEYTHWDSSDSSRDVMSEMIRQNKRKRVLELINQKDVS